MIANDFVFQNSNPWSCAFDKRTQYTVFWSYFISWHKMLSVELWSRHEAPLPPGHIHKESSVLERLLDGLCLSPFLPGSVLSSMDWKFHESPMWYLYFFQFGGMSTYPSILVQLDYLQNALESLVNWKKTDKVCTRFLVFASWVWISFTKRSVSLHVTTNVTSPGLQDFSQ